MFIPDDYHRHSLTFLLHLSEILEVEPITKYCALLFYEDRLLPLLRGLTEEEGRINLNSGHFRVYPLTLCNLQLLGSACFWISAKLHENEVPSAKTLKSLLRECVTGASFKRKDIIGAERLVLEAINYDITCGPTVYSLLQILLVNLRNVTILGDFITSKACEYLLDIVYDCRSVLKTPKPIVAAAVLAVGYIVCVPLEENNFPLLHWLTKTTNAHASHIERVVSILLSYVMDCPPEECGQNEQEELYKSASSANNTVFFIEEDDQYELCTMQGVV
ncbi:hypothetical protein MPTK1_6g13410 [Marchantia polymorpha subsp. ruderalis]|uniref:Cyclin N-terminal domain-containing protein n=2 Tax=Marchantia polymorpha TaxID=3197 RepID=A0AAF6BRM8_MARPO|nr:hypothetical protein MARPO_0059s0009 [Marchantia polymorpha]BBN14662.1 hypothetical protein Mp_6g13410 [Marchantia polymorpha subsp. ruderalis]|eukprot:PTQ37057.1 hypothetical protein MARPO_0059s0009 [Marchantia polymorpha]